MNNKAIILGMYLVALFIVLTHWYKKQGNKGMPYPSTIVAPSYIYGVLAITSDAIGDLATVLSVGLTFGLYYAVKSGKGTGTFLKSPEKTGWFGTPPGSPHPQGPTPGITKKPSAPPHKKQ